MGALRRDTGCFVSERCSFAFTGLRVGGMVRTGRAMLRCMEPAGTRRWVSSFTLYGMDSLAGMYPE